MESWLYVPIIILAFSIWFWLNRHHSQTSAPSSKKQEKHYHGVSIQPGSKACPAVMQLEGKRFLAREVTILPVTGCTAKKCTCTYRHYDDRRSPKERRYLGVSIKLKEASASSEHRTGTDRRKHSYA